MSEIEIITDGGHRRRWSAAETLKRDYVRINPLPNAETVLNLIGDWIEDYNDNHPHSGLRWRSPREFIKATPETA